MSARSRMTGTAAAFFALVAAAFLLALKPSIHGNDGVQNYAYLRSLMFDGDLNFSNEYTHYFTLNADWFDNADIPRNPATNLPVNLYGIGNSLLWAPWVIVFHSAGLAANALGAHWTLDGYSPLYEHAVGTASCFYASAGLVMLFFLIRRYYTDDETMWGLVIIWLASPLFFYMCLHPSMSHANSFFLSSLFLCLYLGGDGLRRWAALGAVVGLMTLTRYQDAALLTALVPGELWRCHEMLRNTPVSETSDIIRRRSMRYVLFVVTAILFFSPQLLVWNILQGNPWSGPQAYLTQGHINLLAPSHVFSVLFSPLHGLLYWHPALALALTGWFMGISFRREKLICFMAFAAQLWVVSSWSHWWAGASFGQRMFISALPFLAIGAASFVHVCRHRAILTRTVILLLVLWNFGYIVQYASGMIPRQQGMALRTLVYNNIVAVPQLMLRVITGSHQLNQQSQ
ncbi:MAG: hypothetical protein NTY46_16430 [Candidatus Sumerlaeota bacterium]|nr:hypothetical protein [Candidatus Sumerlaeota bacterium]